MNKHIERATWEDNIETTKPRTDWAPTLVGVVAMIAICWTIYVVASAYEVMLIV